MHINEYIIETIEGAARHWYLCVTHGQLVQSAAADIVEGELVVCPCGVVHVWRRVPGEYRRLGQGGSEA